MKLPLAGRAASRIATSASTIEATSVSMCAASDISASELASTPTTTSLQITAARPYPELLDLPWEVPLEEWPEKHLAALPRGISRHIVRFVRLGSRVLAVKETNAPIAHREYRMLRTLNKLDVPSVQPVAVITGRVDVDGEPLNSVLVTRHLQYSLPYRALYSQTLRCMPA